MSLNFYERFKDRMCSISRHGIQELVLKKPSLAQIEHKTSTLPPIHPMERPQNGWSTMKQANRGAEASSEDRKLEIKSQHVPPAPKFKKTQPKLQPENERGISASAFAQSQPPKEDPRIEKRHSYGHSTNSKSVLRLSLPDDMDFKMHLRRLDSVLLQRSLMHQR